jgi:transposase
VKRWERVLKIRAVRAGLWYTRSMDAQPDLTTTSRKALLTIIAEQKAVIDRLQRRIGELEARLNTRGSLGMPGNKSSSRPRAPRKETRKRRDHGFARVRMTPTQQVEHRLEVCPDCGMNLTEGWVQRTREFIEVPVVPVQVTERVFIARVCSGCKRRQVPGVNLGGVVEGRQRLGLNLMSLLVTPILSGREEGRWPIRTIQWYLKTLHQLHLSVGGIVQVLHRVAQQAQGAVAQILGRVRASPVVNANETGWRLDGANGYVWTFATPTKRYFLRRGRVKVVVDEVLDESFGGVLVSDFYVAYHHCPDLKQRCWAHLLRDIHDLKSLHPEDARLARWAQAVHRIYTRAKAIIPPRGQGHRAQLALEAPVLSGCWLFVGPS